MPAVSPLLPPPQVPTRIAGTLRRTVVVRGRDAGLVCGVVRRLGVVVRMPPVSVADEEAVGVDVMRLAEGT